jgi:phosphatidylglycerol lysyltransferase
MHFLIEPDTLSRLEDRRVFVALRDGDVVAYLVASPVPARDGWLVEQIIRGDGAANGTAELLIDRTMRSVAAEGSHYATLGLAPLSHRAEASFSNPPWLRFLIGWARAHGRRFYNFDGLDAFKAKFNPVRWDPVFAIAHGGRFSPRMLYAMLAAFAQGSPITAVATGIVKAASIEMRRLKGAAR